MHLLVIAFACNEKNCNYFSFFLFFFFLLVVVFKWTAKNLFTNNSQFITQEANGQDLVCSIEENEKIFVTSAF